MELNLKILAPLLQCTSIYRCALFMKAKKKKKLFYSSPLIKKLLNFLSLHPSLSLSQSLHSHPLPKLSQSLKLSSSLSYSPLTVDRLTVPSRRSPHRPKPSITDRLTVPSRRLPHRHSPLCRPSSPTHPFYRPNSPTLCLSLLTQLPNVVFVSTNPAH